MAWMRNTKQQLRSGLHPERTRAHRDHPRSAPREGGTMREDAALAVYN